MKTLRVLYIFVSFSVQSWKVLCHLLWPLRTDLTSSKEQGSYFVHRYTEYRKHRESIPGCSCIVMIISHYYYLTRAPCRSHNPDWIHVLRFNTNKHSIKCHLLRTSKTNHSYIKLAGARSYEMFSIFLIAGSTIVNLSLLFSLFLNPFLKFRLNKNGFLRCNSNSLV